MKKFGIIATIALCIVGMQNCGGSRVITANLNVSRSTIDNQLTAVESSGTGGSASVTASALQSFFQTLNEEGSTLFYAEAPGSMGNIDFVMPLDYDAFSVETPQKAYAYFAFSNAGGIPHGTLLITAEIGAGGSQTPIIAMDNNGQNFSPGSFTDYDFVMEAAVGSGSVVIRSIDVIDGDFAETMQLEIFNPTPEGEEFLGLVTLTQALN